jgi:hypothetical protein
MHWVGAAVRPAPAACPREDAIRQERYERVSAQPRRTVLPPTGRGVVTRSRLPLTLTDERCPVLVERLLVCEWRHLVPTTSRVRRDYARRMIFLDVKSNIN